jgi:hypothetical protein
MDCHTFVHSSPTLNVAADLIFSSQKNEYEKGRESGGRRYELGTLK